MMGGNSVRRFIPRFFAKKSFSGATRIEFLDILTAILVLGVLVYAASRQFPAYSTTPGAAPAQSQAH